MDNRQNKNGLNAPIEPGDHYNKMSLSSLIKDQSIKSPNLVRQKKDVMEQSFYQGFDRDQSMTKIAFFNQNKLAQSTTLLHQSISSPKFNKTQKKFHVQNSIRNSPLKIQPVPSQGHLAQYLLKKDIKQLQTLVAIRDRVPEDDEERPNQPIMIEDSSEPSPKKTFNMTHNIDHGETRQMLKNIGQYEEKEINVDLSFDEHPNGERPPDITVEEEFRERARRIKKREEEIEQRKYFEDKICNRPSPTKKTMDNRVQVDINKKIDPNLREFFPQEHNFDKYQFFEGKDQQSKLDEIQKQTVFARNNKFNKKQIFNKMVELIYMNASQHINRATADNPQVLNANKNHWFQMMLKNPRLQKFYSHFNEQLSVIMKEEIENNKSNFDLFMLHPRPEKGNICNLYPTKRMLLPEEKSKEMRMINNSIDNAKEKYNYKKEKKKLIEQMRYGREKAPSELELKEMSKSVDKAQFKHVQGMLKQGLTKLIDKAKKNQANKKIVIEKPMSDFQMILKEQAGNIDDLIASLDEDNDIFKKDLKTYEDGHNELKQSHGQFMSIIPGQDIEKILDEMNTKYDEMDIDKNEFNKFANELALSLKQYEQKIKDEIKGHEQELAYKTRLYEGKFQDIQYKTQMQLEAYEMVLTELKLKHMQEAERINMYNCELESKILNSAIPEYQIDELVKQVDTGLVLKNTVEARGYIQRLANMVKSQQKTVKMFKELSQNSDSFVAVAQENLIKERATSKVNIQLRHYYQRLLMKTIRDCGILEDEEHEQDYDNFCKINEFSERDQDQKFYRRILDEIGIEKHLIDFSNKFVGQQANLEEISGYLDDLGLNKEIIQTDQRLMEVMQEQALEREEKERKRSKHKKDKDDEKPESRPKIGYIDMTLDKYNQDDVQTLLKHALSGYLEEPVATLESGQPDYDRVESITANIEEQLKDLEETKNTKKLKVKKKGSSLTKRKRGGRKNSSKQLDDGLNTPDSDTSRDSNNLNSFGKHKESGQQSKNVKELLQTPKAGSDDQTPIQNTIIQEEDNVLGEASPSPVSLVQKKEVDLLADVTNQNSTEIRNDEDQDIEPKKSETGEEKTVPNIDVDDTSDKDLSGNEKEDEKIEEDLPVPVVKQIIMSLDSSSVEEQIEKSEKESDKKSDQNKNLLSVKKKKPPMIRLNSKPVLALQSKNNKDVANFKSKLEEGLKQQFEDLLSKIQEDIAQIEENKSQSKTPISDSASSTSKKSSVKSIKESIRHKTVKKQLAKPSPSISHRTHKSVLSRVSKKSKAVITSSDELSERSEKDSISITSSIKGSVSEVESKKASGLGTRSKTRPPSPKRLTLNPVKMNSKGERPASNTSKRPNQKKVPVAKNSNTSLSQIPKKHGSIFQKAGDKSKVANIKKGTDSKNIKDGSASKNLKIKNTSKRGKIKIAPLKNKKQEKAKDDIKKTLKMPNTKITEESKEKNDTSDLEMKSQSSISIKSSGDDSLSSGELGDEIDPLKKAPKALPIVGDLSLEMRQSSRNVQQFKEISEGVLSKVSSIMKPRTFINDEGVEVLEEVKPIITVNDTLNNLYVPKYQKTMKDADKAAKQAEGFKLNARAIQDFQQVVEDAMGSTIGYDDSQRMFDDPSIQSFFDIYSELIAQNFKFEQINKFINQRGEVEEEEEVVEEVKSPEKKKKKGKKGKVQEKDIVFGDIIKPTFNEQGEFIGCQIRTELVNAIYVQQDNKALSLKRIIKCCSFINRIMRDGLKDDFLCIQMKSGEVAKKGREFVDSATETEDKYFPKVAEPLSDTQMLVYWSLKEHCIDLLTRMNPSKRSYQNLMWEERTIVDLWNYSMPNLFGDYSHFQEDEHTQITFGDYLNGLFRQIQFKLDQAMFPKGDKENLIIERFIKLGMDQDDKKVIKIPISVGIQASVYTKEQEIQTYQMPGYTSETLIQEMLPKKNLNLSKTRIRKDGPKNQLILDRELENQFEQTLDLFDVYVNNLSFIDQQRFNEQEFNKVKLEVDMANNTLIDTSEKKKSNKDPKIKTSMDTQEDMEYDVKKIREKINYTIDEINKDPQLLEKFKNKKQAEIDAEKAANPMKVFDLKPDKVGWLNEISQKEMQGLNHDSTENTLYERDSTRSAGKSGLLPMINTNSNFSSVQNFKKNNGPFDQSKENLSHASAINVTKKTKHTNSPETTGDYEPRDRMNQTTLQQSQSHQYQSAMFIKPSATIKVKPNLRASMQHMNTTKNNLNKSFAVFKDPLDDIVTRKKRKVHHSKNNSLYQSHAVPSQAMTNTDIAQSDLQALRHRNETIGQFIGRVNKRDNLPIPNQILDKAINNRGKNFEWYNGEIQNQFSYMTKNQFNQGSIQRLYNTIDRVQEHENVQRDNERYKRTMMEGFGNKLNQLNKFNATQSSLSYLSSYQNQMRMTQIDKSQIGVGRENHFDNPKPQYPLNINGMAQKFASPLKIYSIKDPYSPQSKIKMLQMKAKAVGMGTQCDDETPNVSINMNRQRNIQFKTLSSGSSQDSSKQMNEIIHKKPVQIENSRQQLGGYISSKNFGTKDSYRPDTEENQVFLTKKFSKQHIGETDEEKSETKGTVNATERTLAEKSRN